MRSNAVVLSAPVTGDAGAMDKVLTLPEMRVRSASELNAPKETLLKIVLDEARRTGRWETLSYVIMGSAAIGAIAISFIGPR